MKVHILFWRRDKVGAEETTTGELTQQDVYGALDEAGELTRWKEGQRTSYYDDGKTPLVMLWRNIANFRRFLDRLPASAELAEQRQAIFKQAIAAGRAIRENRQLTQELYQARRDLERLGGKGDEDEVISSLVAAVRQSDEMVASVLAHIDEVVMATEQAVTAKEDAEAAAEAVLRRAENLALLQGDGLSLTRASSEAVAMRDAAGTINWARGIAAQAAELRERAERLGADPRLAVSEAFAAITV